LSGKTGGPTKIKTASVVTFAAVAIGLTALSGWDGCGHEIVATVAYEQLPSGIKAKVDKIFANDPRGRTFIDSATWPDDIKGGERNAPPSAPMNKSWHFIDIPYTASSVEIENILSNDGVAVNVHIEKTANVVTAINFYANYLKSGRGSQLAKADALSFLVHFVGDIHQPLHCVTVLDPIANYTPPAGGDLGGNGLKITHPAKELHALWDDTFDEPTDNKGTGRDSSVAHAKQVADAVRQKFQSTADEVADDDPTDWAKESYAFRQVVYNLPVDPNAPGTTKSYSVSADYLAAQQQIAGARVVLAGDRLATLLKWIYGN
jgi:S1/P1 Nuclease